MGVPAIVIGSGTSDHVAISVLRSERPESDDYCDGNWVDATVRIYVGAFRGEYAAALRTDEIAELRSGLVRLNAELSGTATFASCEQWLQVRIEGDGRGHFLATCEARDAPGRGCTLHFVLAFDQTELPPLIGALDSVLAAFPVRGQPRP